MRKCDRSPDPCPKLTAPKPEKKARNMIVVLDCEDLIITWLWVASSGDYRITALIFFLVIKRLWSENQRAYNLVGVIIILSFLFRLSNHLPMNECHQRLIHMLLTRLGQQSPRNHRIASEFLESRLQKLKVEIVKIVFWTCADCSNERLSLHQ